MLKIRPSSDGIIRGDVALAGGRIERYPVSMEKHRLVFVRKWRSIMEVKLTIERNQSADIRYFARSTAVLQRLSITPPCVHRNPIKSVRYCVILSIQHQVIHIAIV